MNAIDEGGYAFPRPDTEVLGGVCVGSPGMSLREWFAGQIACGDAAAGGNTDDGWTSNMAVLPEFAERRAAIYYAVADAMIAHRNKPKLPASTVPVWLLDTLKECAEATRIHRTAVDHINTIDCDHKITDVYTGLSITLTKLENAIHHIESRKP